VKKTKSVNKERAANLQTRDLRCWPLDELKSTVNERNLAEYQRFGIFENGECVAPCASAAAPTLTPP
jgi:hypothetical protein